MAHTMCVVTQLPKEMGGANGKVAYIDTEGAMFRKTETLGIHSFRILGTFRPERIHQIADRFGLEPGPVLENIVHGERDRLH